LFSHSKINGVDAKGKRKDAKEAMEKKYPMKSKARLFHSLALFT
jgi:hypothetical protein